MASLDDGASYRGDQDNVLEWPKLARPPPNVPGLSGGGSDGTFDGMEPRVAKLEAHVEHMREAISGMAKSVATLTETTNRIDRELAVLGEKVSHLPSKGWSLTVAAAIMAVLVAATTLAPRLQTLFGTAPVTTSITPTK